MSVRTSTQDARDSRQINALFVLLALAIVALTVTSALLENHIVAIGGVAGMLIGVALIARAEKLVNGTARAETVRQLDSW